MTRTLNPARHWLVAVLLLSTALGACSEEREQMFRRPITDEGVIAGALRIDEADTYSVAVEATVKLTVPDARKSAWAYLKTVDADAPLRMQVVIESSGGVEVLRHEAVDPKLSSWDGTHLYLEVARVKLVPGDYSVRASHTGKNLNHQPTFSASLVVVPAYQGK